MNGSIKNNSIVAGGPGIILANFINNNGSFDFTIQENTVAGTNDGGYGLIVARMKEDSNVRIIGNTLLHNTTDPNIVGGIRVNDLPSTTSANIAITNNKIISSVSPADNFEAIIIGNLGGPNSSNLNAAVINNTVSGTGAASTGSFNFAAATTNTLCITLDNNTATGGFSFSTAGTGVINIDSIVGNTGDPVTATGNVNLVAPGTCSR